MKFRITILALLAAVSVAGQSSPVSELMERTMKEYEAYRQAAKEAARDTTKQAVNTNDRPLVFDDNYLYPSIVRAMNFQGDTLLNELSIQMTELTYLTSAGGTKKDALEALNALRPELEEAGFEVWIEYSGDPSGWLVVKSHDELITHLVGAMLQQEKLLIVDYKGKLTPQQLVELRNLDMQKLTGTLNLQTLFGP